MFFGAKSDQPGISKEKRMKIHGPGHEVLVDRWVFPRFDTWNLDVAIRLHTEDVVSSGHCFCKCKFRVVDTKSSIHHWANSILNNGQDQKSVMTKPRDPGPQGSMIAKVLVFR